MKNTQHIIGQHYKSVAQSFLKYGYTGPVNVHTLNAMVDYYGKPYLQTLSNCINNQSRYDGKQMAQIEPYLGNEDASDNVDTGIVKNPTHLAALDNPNWTGGLYPVQTIKQQPYPADYGITPMLMPTVLQGNGGMLTPPPVQYDQPLFIAPSAIDNPITNLTTQSTDPFFDMEDEKTFWEKYGNIIIAALVIMALLFITRRSTPVIIK